MTPTQKAFLSLRLQTVTTLWHPCDRWADDAFYGGRFQDIMRAIVRENSW